MRTPTLAEIQALVTSLVVAPEGVAAALDTLPAQQARIWEGLVRGGPRLSAVERLDIYANMYFFRLRDAVAEDFPALRETVGADRFHNLITDYLLVHRPSHYSLRWAGAHLSEFVRRHELSQRWPFLAELAALEWALLAAFDAADAEPIRAAVVQEIDASSWAELRFRFAPSLQVLHGEWPVHQVWQSVQSNQPGCDIDPQETHLRVWRQELRVYHDAMDATQSAALRSLLSGQPFADACGAAAAHCDDDTAVQRMAEFVARWLADGMITGFEVPDR